MLLFEIFKENRLAKPSQRIIKDQKHRTLLYALDLIIK